MLLHNITESSQLPPLQLNAVGRNLTKICSEQLPQLYIFKNTKKIKKKFKKKNTADPLKGTIHL